MLSWIGTNWSAVLTPRTCCLAEALCREIAQFTSDASAGQSGLDPFQIRRCEVVLETQRARHATRLSHLPNSNRDAGRRSRCAAASGNQSERNQDMNEPEPNIKKPD